MAEHERPFDDDEILTTEDLARVVHRDPATVRLWRRHGEGPDSFVIRSRIYYRAGVVRQWLARNEQAGR